MYENGLMSGVVVPKRANFTLAHCHGLLAGCWERKGRERPPSVTGLDFLANAERGAATSDHRGLRSRILGLVVYWPTNTCLASYIGTNC